MNSSIGHRSPAAARAAVAASSVTLEPGASADVLLVFDPTADLVMADGGCAELVDLPLSVRSLGLTSTRSVPLLLAPLTVVGGDAHARLEREGRFADSR